MYYTIALSPYCPKALKDWKMQLFENRSLYPKEEVTGVPSCLIPNFIICALFLPPLLFPALPRLLKKKKRKEGKENEQQCDRTKNYRTSSMLIKTHVLLLIQTGR